MILVYSLGGSILAGRDAKSLQEYADALKELAKAHQIYVVVGGGRIAREYIEKARDLGASEMFCDLIGIGATKLNSALLIAALGRAAPRRSRRPMPRLLAWLAPAGSWSWAEWPRARPQTP